MKNYTILVKYNEKEPLKDYTIKRFKAKDDVDACYKFQELKVEFLEHRKYISKIKLLHGGRKLIENYI